MNKLVIFGAVGVLLLGGGGGAAYMFLFKKKDEHVEAPKVVLPPAYLQVEQIQVPLPRPGKPPLYHFVTVSLLTTEPGKVQVTAVLPKLRDAWIREVNTNSFARKDDPTELDLDLLKQRLLKLTEQVMDGPVVTDVLIVRATRGL